MVGHRCWCWSKPSQRQKVVVIWSRAAIASPFVLHEAITARDGGKLIQVKTSDVQLTDIPRPMRVLPALNASDLASIATAVNDRKPRESELPQSERRVGRQLGDSHAAKSETEISTTVRRPITEPRAARRSRGVFALATAFVAVVAAAVIWQPELSDALSVITNKLLALLKWNLVLPVGALLRSIPATDATAVLYREDKRTSSASSSLGSSECRCVLDQPKSRDRHWSQRFCDTIFLLQGASRCQSPAMMQPIGSIVSMTSARPNSAIWARTVAAFL
jgi:hypothetical protein